MGYMMIYDRSKHKALWDYMATYSTIDKIIKLAPLTSVAQIMGAISEVVAEGGFTISYSILQGVAKNYFNSYVAAILRRDIDKAKELAIALSNIGVKDGVLCEDDVLGSLELLREERKMSIRSIEAKYNVSLKEYLLNFFMLHPVITVNFGYYQKIWKFKKFDSRTITFDVRYVWQDERNTIEESYQYKDVEKALRKQ